MGAGSAGVSRMAARKAVSVATVHLFPRERSNGQQPRTWGPGPRRCPSSAALWQPAFSSLRLRGAVLPAVEFVRRQAGVQLEGVPADGNPVPVTESADGPLQPALADVAPGA